MTNREPSEIDGLEIPEALATACTCFTELKLSQTINHAEKFGRLGIGFKRPFVFNRGGRPVVYYGNPGEWAKEDKFLEKCAIDLQDKRLMHFFKPMFSSPCSPLIYDLFEESEWRIVFSGNFEFGEKKKVKILEPCKTGIQESEYFQTLCPKQQDKLRYLIPLDGWLALIIYPSVSIKNMAQGDKEIRTLIGEIKSNQDDHANVVEGGNLPAEMDLDLCRNF